MSPNSGHPGKDSQPHKARGHPGATSLRAPQVHARRRRSTQADGPNSRSRSLSTVPRVTLSPGRDWRSVARLQVSEISSPRPRHPGEESGEDVACFEGQSRGTTPPFTNSHVLSTSPKTLTPFSELLLLQVTFIWRQALCTISLG